MAGGCCCFGASLYPLLQDNNKYRRNSAADSKLSSQYGPATKSKRHSPSQSTTRCRSPVMTDPLTNGVGITSRLNSFVSEEHDLIAPNPDFSAQAHVPSPDKYLEMYQRSIGDPAGFWADIASQFYWKQKWASSPVCSQNLDVRKGRINIEWFKGGITNICYNCLDANIAAGNGDKIAIYWEGNEPGVDST